MEMLDSDDTGLGNFCAVPRTQCPKGHLLVPSSRGKVFSKKCDRCDRHFKRERHMCCDECNYRVCYSCWEDSTPKAARKPGRGGFGFMMELKCPRDHLMERLEGTSIRGAARCKKCSAKELGVVFPFFWSCQLCQYELCPACA